MTNLNLVRDPPQSHDQHVRIASETVNRRLAKAAMKRLEQLIFDYVQKTWEKPPSLSTLSIERLQRAYNNLFLAIKDEYDDHTVDKTIDNLLEPFDRLLDCVDARIREVAQEKAALANEFLRGPELGRDEEDEKAEVYVDKALMLSWELDAYRQELDNAYVVVDHLKTMKMKGAGAREIVVEIKL